MQKQRMSRSFPLGKWRKKADCTEYTETGRPSDTVSWPEGEPAHLRHMKLSE